VKKDYLIINSLNLGLNFSNEQIENLYSEGYLMSRQGRGIFNQTRSLRIVLDKFSLNTKNNRVLRRNTDISIVAKQLPMSNQDYSWQIHQLGSNFYRSKFGDMIMSASKIKSMCTSNKENPNFILKYINQQNIVVGYCISYQTDNILHYAYPFYDLSIPKDKFLGMAMIIKAILYSKSSNKKYFYLGSVVDPKSIYKLQFNGIEWFDESLMIWITDIKKLKSILLDNTIS